MQPSAVLCRRRDIATRDATLAACTDASRQVRSAPKWCSRFLGGAAPPALGSASPDGPGAGAVLAYRADGDCAAGLVVRHPQLRRRTRSRNWPSSSRSALIELTSERRRWRTRWPSA